MSLFLPSSRESIVPFSDINLIKGQLYNLDLDEKISFQFNPEAFTYEKSFNWATVAWKGSEDGGDLQYLNTGPIGFDLPLIFAVEPGAPIVTSESVEERVSQGSDLPADFEKIEEALNRWEKPLENKGRPSRLRIIMGPRNFDGVISKLTVRITEYFPDLTAREVLFTIGFRQWVIN